MRICDSCCDGLMRHSRGVRSAFFMFGEREVEAKGGDAGFGKRGCQGCHEYMIHPGARSVGEGHDGFGRSLRNDIFGGDGADGGGDLE